MNRANQRAAITMTLMFAVLFMFSYLTRNSIIIDFSEGRDTSATAANRFTARLCPMGDYDKLRGLMVLWRQETATVSEHPWQCLSPYDKSAFVEALLNQRAMTRVSARPLEIRSAESGRRLASVAPGGRVVLD